MKMNPSFEDMSKYYDTFFYEGPFKDIENITKLEALSIATILKKTKTTSILDCASGTGVQALGLAAMGYHVSASDISPKLITILKSKAKIKKLRINAKVANFRSLVPWRNKHFDAVICAGNSLPLLDSKDQMIKAIRAMRSVLNPNHGVLIIGLHNYKVPRSKKETILLRKLSSKDLQFDKREFGNNRVKIAYFICEIEPKTVKSEVFYKSYAYVDPIEGAKLLRSLGFRKINTYDIRGRMPYKGGEWGFAAGFL